MSPKSDNKSIPIRRVNPRGVKPEFTNDLSITRSDHEVFLTFSVIEPPSITSEEDLDRVADVEAVAVAKLVLTPEFAEAALKALSLHLKKSSE